VRIKVLRFKFQYLGVFIACLLVLAQLRKRPGFKRAVIRRLFRWREGDQTVGERNYPVLAFKRTLHITKVIFQSRLGALLQSFSLGSSRGLSLGLERRRLRQRALRFRKTLLLVGDFPLLFGFGAPFIGNLLQVYGAAALAFSFNSPFFSNLALFPGFGQGLRQINRIAVRLAGLCYCNSGQRGHY